MTRGTFANVRIKNLMVPGTEGGVTMYSVRTEKQMSIFDAAMKYQEAESAADHSRGSRIWHRPVARLGGERDASARRQSCGRASFERIHRSNLVGMGVLPLQFLDGVTAQSLGLDGSETFSISGLSDGIQPGPAIDAWKSRRQDGKQRYVPVKVRIDTPIEVDYYRHGGILPFVLRQLLART